MIGSHSLFTTVVIASFAFGCLSGQCETTNVILKFHILSDQKVKNGKFIDTPQVPKAGYVTETSDLTVTNLADVYLTQVSDSTIVDGKPVSGKSQPGLSVVLLPEDAKRFMSLTEKAVGKRLLISVGEKPVSAPKVWTKLETDGFLIEFDKEEDLKKTHNDLKTMISTATQLQRK